MQLSQSLRIEFAGLPKSGKSTVMDVVSHYLRRMGLPVKEFHGGGRYAPIGKNELGRLNLYLACEAVRYCLATHEEDSAPRLHLLDRGLVDRVIFTRALHAMKRVSTAHADSIERLVATPDLRDEIGLCFVFTASPQLSLRRESANRLTGNQGRVMNYTFLTHLRTAALDLLDEHPRTECAQQLVPIDTETADGQVTDTAQHVLRFVSAALRQQGVDVPPPAETGTRTS